MKKKMSITLSEKQEMFIREKSEDMGINMSALISICIDSYMKSQDMITGIKDMSVMMKEMQKLSQAMPIDVNSQDH